MGPRTVVEVPILARWLPLFLSVCCALLEHIGEEITVEAVKIYHIYHLF